MAVKKSESADTVKKPTRVEQVTKLLTQALEREALAKARLDGAKREADRKAEFRRQVIVGALLMKEINAQTDLGRQVVAHLDVAVERPGDRALFGFKPLKPAVQKS